jgi:hypothetical protein
MRLTSACETCPISTEGGTRRVQLVREGGGGGGVRLEEGHAPVANAVEVAEHLREAPSRLGQRGVEQRVVRELRAHAAGEAMVRTVTMKRCSRQSRFRIRARRASARRSQTGGRERGVVGGGSKRAARETCPISTEGWTRRVHFVREGGSGGWWGGGSKPAPWSSPGWSRGRRCTAAGTTGRTVTVRALSRL